MSRTQRFACSSRTAIADLRCDLTPVHADPSKIAMASIPRITPIFHALTQPYNALYVAINCKIAATTASSIRCRTHYQKRQLRNQAQLLVICQFTLGDALAGKTSHAVE